MSNYVEKWDLDEPASSNDRTYSRGIRRGGFEEILKIDVNAIGLIIGRGGSNIKLTQQKYRVHVNIDKQENIVKISGENEDDVHNALKYIKHQADGDSKQRQSINDSSLHGERAKYQSRKPMEHHNCEGYNSNYQSKREQPSQKSNFDYPLKENQYEEKEQDHIIDWDAANKRCEIERAKRWAQCPKLTKNFYKEHEEVSSLTKEEVATILAENNNTSVARVFKESENNKCGKDNIPNPIWKFEHCFEQYPDLLAEIKKQGFTHPSPIQAQAWPVLLEGEDLIGIAQTGTGKTLAFLLPAMIHTEFQPIPRSERTGPNVLVMAPTRELALQIEKEVNKYSFRGMKAVCVYGGGNRRDQICEVQKGVEIIICTPGRLNDLIKAHVIDVNTVTYLVLDEADRMLDLGFEPQIRKILLDIRPDRQTVMTSATWPPGVRRLAQSYMNNPIQICVGSLDLAATHTVKQIIEIMEEDEKYTRVKNFIENMLPDDKIIIFCGKNVLVTDLSSDLTVAGVFCQCIHGSLDQADREQAIADISSGDVKILIATDVASRGLDIEDITHVINYNFPHNIEEYVHRVGRTGRAGRSGVSISYLTRSDWAMSQPLIDILKEAGQDIPDELLRMADRFKAMKDRRNNELGKTRFFRGSSGRGGNSGSHFDRGGGGSGRFDREGSSGGGTTVFKN